MKLATKLLSTLFFCAVSSGASAQLLEVESTSPDINALNATAATDIAFTFSENIDAATLTNATVHLSGNQGLLIRFPAPAVTANTATFNPDRALFAGEILTATLTTGVAATSGTNLAAPFSYRFTAAVNPLSPGAFPLGRNTITTDVENALSVTTADLDGDGDLDVLSASSGDNRIAWYENDGLGGFGAQQIIVGASSDAQRVDTADLDGDGDLDVLSASSGDDRIAWYPNDGSGNFGSQQNITRSARTASDVTTADLDGDGDLDVISTSRVGGAVAWYENNGAGSFVLLRTIDNLAASARTVTTADLDGDGDIDVIAGSASGGDIRNDRLIWYINNGNRGFDVSRTISTRGAFDVTTGDLDGDGDLDVLSTSFEGGPIWYANDGNGGFGNAQTNGQSITDLFDRDLGVAVADLDGDGDLDVLSASNGGNRLVWYANDGRGDFGAQQIINTGTSGAIDITTGDLDGDGDLDVLSATLIRSRIDWYENAPERAVEISTSTGVGREAQTTVITVTVEASAVVIGDQTVDLGVSGADITGTDFSLSNPRITILDGQTAGTATFTINNDTAIEGPETATLTISNPSEGIRLGARTTRNINIIDNDFPVVNLSLSANAGTEADTTSITVTATASQAVSGDQGVNLGVSGTGITNSDFSLSNPRITILNGQTSGTVTFTIEDDLDIETTETATLTISNSSAGIRLGATATQNITITDNDVPTVELPDIPVITVGPPIICEGNDALLSWRADLNDATEWRVYTGSCGGTLLDNTVANSVVVGPHALSPVSYFIRGEGGPITPGLCGSVTITPTPRENAVVSYPASRYLTTDTDPTPTITGVTGGSFRRSSGPNGLVIDTNTGTIDLSGSTVGTYEIEYQTPATCSGRSTVTVTIEGPSNVDLSVTSNSGSESAATAITLTATASGVVNGDQTINVAVSGTGITASDFSLSNTTITILNGQTTGTAIFTVQDDAQREGPETATLTISNPSAGLALGTTTTQNIRITDDDLPAVTSVSPTANSIAAVDSNIVLSFSEAIAAIDANATNIVVQGNQTGLIDGVFSGGDSNTITFNPVTNFAPGDLITVTIAEAITSPAFIYQFTATVSPADSVGFVNGQQTITTAVIDVRSVTAADLDGDGDLDVLSASALDDRIAWYENDGTSRFGAQQTITTAADGAQGVTAADLDGDGDMDVLSASFRDDRVAWYENDGAGGFGAQQTITTAADGAGDVTAADLDGDGDMDVLSASHNDDRIAWYENDGTGNFGAQQSITTAANGAESVTTADLDGDGDLDILSASLLDDRIAWYENDGTGGFGAQQTITTAADSAHSVTAADLDGDGDLDVLSASANDDRIAWYENDGTGGFGAQQTITTAADGAWSVIAADLDGDGDMDVLSASLGDGRIAWYANSAPPVVELNVSANTGTETGTTAITVTATATNAVVGDQTVAIAVGGTGITASDFSLSNTTITIPDGQTTGTAIFTVQDDAQREGTETATLTISNPSAGLALGTTTTQNITITDDDLPAVTSVSPTANSIAAVDSNIVLSFSDAIAAIDANATNIVVQGNQTGLIAGVFSGGGSNTITFSPATNFTPGELITVTITEAIITPAFTYQFTATVSPADSVGFVNGQQTITIAADAAASVTAADLDGDGDVDVLSASANDDRIAWYENDGTGNFGVQQTITTAANGAESVTAADLDDDGDLDVLSASQNDDRIAWYENDGTGSFGAQQIITTAANGAGSVTVADLDGDGDLDVLSASSLDDRIAWYENDGTGVFGAQQTITTAANRAQSVTAADLDGDGDLDVLSASGNDDRIAWYENDGRGGFSAQQTITTAADLARSVAAADLDGDGDLDVLSASQLDDRIAWYENDGRGGFGAQQTITTAASMAFSVTAADLDGDGDLDVLSASFLDDRVAWYENDGTGGFGAQQTITTAADFALSVTTADLDGDGDLDVLSASLGDDRIAWYENSAPPVVELNVSANTGTETATTAITVTATAANAVVGDQTVAIVVGGTGITASDFSLSNTTITILNGQTTGTAIFTVQNDTEIEGSETATLTISNPSAGLALGTTITQNITITDDDLPAVNVSVSANAGTEASQTAITVTATASQAVVGDQTVDLGVTGAGITAGDFSLSDTTITIANGQITGVATFTVRNDAIVEGTETATLIISNPSAGLTLGTTITQNITITDNLDRDGDGVPDDIDNCPFIPNSDQADFEGDGIGDVCDSDTDGDGLPDDYELANGLNPRNSLDRDADPDGDGFTNIEEFEFGSNPQVADTDDNNNGIPDAVETQAPVIVPILQLLLLDDDE